MSLLMKLTPDSLLEILSDLGIPNRLYKHPAVFSTADAQLLPEPIPGIATKNLFLRDEKKRRYVLLCLRDDTRVDLKQLGKQLELKGVTFANAEDLSELLALTPGSVCLFGLAHDQTGKVEAFLDNSLELTAEMQNHPLINTATVVLKVSDMLKYCAHFNHPLKLIEVPVRKAG